MNKLLWVVTLLSIAGVILNIKKNRLGFACWIVTNVIWCSRNFYIKEYAQSTLFFIYFGLAIWGWVRWKNNA